MGLNFSGRLVLEVRFFFSFSQGIFFPFVVREMVDRQWSRDQTWLSALLLEWFWGRGESRVFLVVSWQGSEQRWSCGASSPWTSVQQFSTLPWSSAASVGSVRGVLTRII